MTLKPFVSVKQACLRCSLYCVLTSWRNTNPEIPATNSARKTSDRNMAYCRERRRKRDIRIVCIKTVCLSVSFAYANTHT